MQDESGGPSDCQTAKLRILATTDLHMALTSYDYAADRPDPTIGLTRTATLIEAARAEARAEGRTVLLFDNGDGFQGSPLTDSPDCQPGHGRHPLARAFETLNYDAVGLGNHDFTFGIAGLRALIAGVPCPVLCSNMYDRQTGKSPVFDAVAILERTLNTQHGPEPVRIGVFSVLPPQTAMWEPHLSRDDVRIDGIVDAAAHWSGHLRRAGCDLIVALAHSGLGEDDAAPGQENAIIPLAALDNVDVLIAGHTHMLLPIAPHKDRTDLHGKPVVMAGAAGSHLGVIDLNLRRNNKASWRIGHHSSSLRPVARRDPGGAIANAVPESPKLVRLFAPVHHETLARMHRPVGQTETPLHSYFTFFAGDAGLARVAEAQIAAIAPYIGDAPDLPLISAAAPAKSGGRSGPASFTDVPKGPVLERHLVDLQVFDDNVRACILTGAELRRWLEMSASQFAQLEPGTRGTALRNPDMPGHGFDVLFGLSYQIDLAAPAMFRADGTALNAGAGRIRHLRHNGAPVPPDKRFVVVLNDHRANGGGYVAALSEAVGLPLPDLSIRDALRNHLSVEPALRRPCFDPAPWGFCPMPATQVSVLTGPGAEPHLSTLGHRQVENLGINADGFLQLLVSL